MRPVPQPDQKRNDSSTADAARDYLTAEDVLEAIQKQRPEDRVIRPVGYQERDREVLPQGLLPEGSRIENRRGSLAPAGTWWTFISDDPSEVPALKLLPDASLESMVRTVTGTSAKLSFEVSGEITVFEGENYLLPRVAIRSRPVDQPASQPEAVGETGGDGKSTRQAPALDAPPEDLLRLLQAEEPPAQVVSINELPAPPTPHDIAGTPGPLVPEGSPIVERPGRIIRRGDWWTFVFESDHPDCPEPPMRVLPCRSLELMVEAAQRETSGLVFIVSGRATVFENNNYLLPRIARLRIDSGNLSK
jgi:hypothetical protein